ncbi:MAG TPA: tetratricopeptide repeat protein [Anaerolineae bacterium]|nr:tetratricopeptide repeat protein [Anaerolineae bacterium]
MNEISPVITSKIVVPRKRPDLLHRPRLVDFLHQQIVRKLIIVSAPAGYGKTSLLVDFAHETEIPICWYSLDAYDADPRIFLEHLIASVRHRFPEFGYRAEAAVRNSGDLRRNLYPLAAVLANEIYEIPDYFALVLDDFHLVDHSEVVTDFLSLLLRYLEENCHLTVASRTLPGIPDQALMVARGEMVGLGVEELRFTPQEIQALVAQNYNLNMPYDRAEELTNFSDGWITGILLTAHQATWEKLLQGVVSAPEATGRVYDYLAEQVFTRQPPELRQFLLGSAVLEQMTPGLCDELLDIHDSEALLELAEGKHLFISQLQGVERCYVYHHLFREFLLQRLRRGDREQYQALYVKAARIYERQGEWERAVEAYLKLQLYEEAARVIELAEKPMYDAGRWDTLARWLDALPRPVFLARPRLVSLRGQIHMDMGETLAAMPLFEQALAQFRRAGDKAEEARTLIKKAIALRYQGRYKESIQYGRQALALLPQLEEVARPLLEAHIDNSEGLCCYFLGRPGEAVEKFTRAVVLFEQKGDNYNAANAYHNLGIAYRAMGRIAEAMECYRSALGYWQKAGNPGVQANTLNSLGVVYYLQGEWEEAARIYAQALDKARQTGLTRAEVLILAGLGDLHRDRGEFREALQAYSEGLQLAEKAADAFIVLYIQSGMGDTYRLMGDLEKAEKWIESALGQAEKSRSAYALGLCRIALGVLHCEQGRLQEALEHLLAAVQGLQEAGIRHELARAHLHLAQTLFLQGHEQESLTHLSRVGELVEQLGYDHFLVVEGRRMQLLLRRAARESLCGGRFARVLERIAPMAPVVRQEAALEVSTAPSLTIHAFGRACILRGEDELLGHREQVKELFFYLLAHHPHPVRKEEVMELFWDGFSSPKADGALRVTLYRLRRAVCPVTSEGGWLALELPDHDYDVAQFEQFLRTARALKGDGEKQMACYEQAIALYRGSYLEQCGSLWALPERERLRREYVDALLALARLHLGRNDYHGAVALYQRAVQEEAYQEEAWQGLMRAQALTGNRAAAIEEYQQLTRLLREDLGLDPAPETQALYRQILEMRL